MAQSAKASYHARARQLAAAVSALHPELDHGDGALFVIALAELEHSGRATVRVIAAIAREAEADAGAQCFTSYNPVEE